MKSLQWQDVVMVLGALGAVALWHRGGLHTITTVSEPSHLYSTHPVPFVVTLCSGGNRSVKIANVTTDERQLRQTIVLLKSAALATRTRLRFILLSDDIGIYEKVTKKIAQWPPEFSSRILLQFRPIFVPKESSILEMYDRCSTERLYLPRVLPDVDSVVYLDTDMIFLRPPELLAQQFNLFDQKHVFGMAQLDGYYSSINVAVPYVGKGLSAVPLLVNLTRWRQGSIDEQTLEAIILGFKDRFDTGDQDVLNMVLIEKPDLVYQLGCEWHGHLEQCTETKWECKSVQRDGFSLVHGIRGRFLGDEHIEFNMYSRIIFRSWEEHVPGEPMSALVSRLQESLKSSVNRDFCRCKLEALFRFFIDGSSYEEEFVKSIEKFCTT